MFATRLLQRGSVRTRLGLTFRGCPHASFATRATPAVTVQRGRISLALGVGAGLTIGTLALRRETEVFAAVKMTLESAIETADVLYGRGTDSLDALYAHLSDARESFPNSCQITWRLARAVFDSRLKPGLSKDEVKARTYHAHELAKKALDLDPSSFAGQKWAGITLSEVGNFESTSVALANAFIIRDHFAKACELNPQDATSRHLLGVWYFSIAEMPWWQKKIANTIFGEVPKATFEEALSHFLLAEQTDPGFYKKNAIMLAKTYNYLKDKDKAKEWLQKALDMPITSLGDKEDHEEATKLKF